MPLDAQITARADGVEPLEHDLLLDYAPVHKFLWDLKSVDLGKIETLDKFEFLTRQVDLEFPLGYRMAGCYAAKPLTSNVTFDSVKIIDGPPETSGGSIAVAAVLLDKRQANGGDTIDVAAIFHDERGEKHEGDMILLVEARATTLAGPPASMPKSSAQSFERPWSKATDLGQGYRMIAGKLVLPDWIRPGPDGAIDLGIHSRAQGDKGSSHLGLRMPMGPPIIALMMCNGWPTSPISWHDDNYGIGPLKICGKNGHAGQSHGDYRLLHLEVKTSAGQFDVFPARDGRGCADADDAVFTGRFFDQILNDESHLATPDVVRPQPEVTWRNVPVINATDSVKP